MTDYNARRALQRKVGNSTQSILNKKEFKAQTLAQKIEGLTLVQAYNKINRI